MTDKNFPDDDVQRLLKTIVDHFDIEDRPVRERQILMWRRLKLYWDNLSRIYFDSVAHDWRIPLTNDLDQGNDNAYYDKPINIFKAYLESIIAALSVTVPTVSCAPDDADDPDDITTAKAGEKIAELIYKHNNVPLLWLHALFIQVTEGLIACYNYTKEDEKYGTYREPKFENTVEEAYVCPECNANIPDEVLAEREQFEFAPGDDDVALHDVLNNLGPVCPQCAALLDPELQKSPFVVQRIVGYTSKPKSRVCLEVYGGLFVKVPNYAMRQADIPYLFFDHECNWVDVVDKYKHLKTNEKIRSASPTGPNDPYEQWGRLSTQYRNEYPINVVTVRNAWLRPCAFNECKNDEDTDKLKRLYPDGCKVVFVNGEFAAAYNESLDDCWTLSHNPMADYLHHQPMGELLTNVQDITNDLIALTIQTIEQGIPQTFADPSVLDFDAYSQREVSPGAINPAVPRTGKSMADGFYEVKTATLSAEILPFFQQVQELGQLATGALPSLFGGGPTEGSKTAAEYSMSRAQALQRLQNTWKMLSTWWKEVFGKAIPSYIKTVVEDEKFVKKDYNGDYVNVWIRKSELEGKIGDIELEANEQLPITWGQKRDIMMQFINGGNPEILQMLGAPENLGLVKDVVGIPEFKVPGEADRIKALDEIKILVQEQPITMPPDPMMAQESMMMGQMPQPVELPSVEVDPLLDNHQIESEICRQWLIGEAGRLAKIENPGGYRNVLLHMKAHMDILAQQQMQQQMMDAASQGGDKGNPSNNKKKQPPQKKENSNGPGPESAGTTSIN